MSDYLGGIHELKLEDKEIAGMQAELDRQLAMHGGDANKVYASLGQAGLVDIAGDTAPVTSTGLAKVCESMDEDPGIAVLHNTRISTVAPELGKLTAITLSSVFGEPTRTDRRSSQIAWPVRYDPGVQGQATFSQTTDEAAMHTDSAFARNPEKYFGLYCVESDVPPKGTNHFISAPALLGTMEITEDTDVVDALFQPFPFKAPAAFVDTGDGETVEVNWAPIFDEDGRVRYRYDTIIDALKLPDIEITGLQQQALAALERHLRQADRTVYHLQPDQAVVVNNHTVLHQRNPFDNTDRLLYRVRMDAAA